jgi:hypothetical protein
MKALRRSEGTAPLIPYTSITYRCAVHFTSRPLYRRGRIAVPTEYEVGWAPDMVWRFQIRKKSFAHVGIGTADHPTGSLVSVPSILSVLPARFGACLTPSTRDKSYLPMFFDNAANFVRLKTTRVVIKVKGKVTPKQAYVALRGPVV